MTCDPEGLLDLLDINATSNHVDFFYNWPSQLAYLCISKSAVNEGSPIVEFSLFAFDESNKHVSSRRPQNRPDGKEWHS